MDAFTDILGGYRRLIGQVDDGSQDAPIVRDSDSLGSPGVVENRPDTAGTTNPGKIDD